MIGWVQTEGSASQILEKVDQLSPVLDTQLAIHTLNVIFDRAAGNEQFIFNVFVGLAGEDQQDDLLFSGRKTEPGSFFLEIDPALYPSGHTSAMSDPQII